MKYILTKLKNLADRLSKLGKLYAFQISGLAILLIVGGMVHVLNIESRLRLPKSTRSFAATSVKIVDKSKQGGGSGVILKSSSIASEILTNKHVCRLVEDGGFVVSNGEFILIEAIKKYPYHDLCLVLVRRDLGVDTIIAKQSPAFFSKAYISGHPGLLPHVLTIGNFSGFETLQMVVGIKKCPEKPSDYEVLACIFLGGVPVVEAFSGQLVTGTILPGSSGSAVFNEYGEISGLVFAGRSRELGYAFVVPYAYILHFTQNQRFYRYQKVGNVKYSNLIRRIFNVQQVCDQKNIKLCDKTIPNSIEL